MNFSEAKAKKIDHEENKAWLEMLDSLVDFISASKTMIKIMNDKLIGNGTTKDDNSYPDLTKTQSLPGEVIKEIHVNSAFSKTTPMTSYANILQEDMHNKITKNFPRHHSTSQFVNEQYDLTKQTIARRFRPQNRLSTVANTKISPRTDNVMNDTFTEGIYRIASPKERSMYQERRGGIHNMDHRYSAKNKYLMCNSFQK